MPFKHNAARHYRISKTRFRVRNWPAYEAGLKRRGDLTLWPDEAAFARPKLTVQLDRLQRGAFDDIAVVHDRMA
jgi:hypothetical protein